MSHIVAVPLGTVGWAFDEQKRCKDRVFMSHNCCLFSLIIIMTQI